MKSVKRLPDRGRILSGSPDFQIKKYKTVGETVVELDQFKTELNSYEGPLVEVRDSL